MGKIPLKLSFAVILLVFYGLYIIDFDLSITKDRIIIEKDQKYNDYKGLTHVHSNLSTGTEAPESLIKLAIEQKLDFMFFTEVNYFSSTSDREGYFGPLLLLCGSEFSYLDSRLLYFNSKSEIKFGSLGRTQVFLSDILSTDEDSQSVEEHMTILAHPFHRRHKWKGEYPLNLSGIEIINLKQILDRTWVKSKLKTLFGVAIYLLNPKLALMSILMDPTDETQLWDQLNKKRNVSGMVGTDATAKAIIFEDFAFKFPSYKTSFSVASNHVLLKSELTGEFKSDKAKIIEGLKNGKHYLSFDFIGSPKGFYMEAIQKYHTFGLGSTLPWKPETKIAIQIPDLKKNTEFEVILFKNGQKMMTSSSLYTLVDIHGPGVFRAEVRVKVKTPAPFSSKWVPWIYTNPIRLTSDTFARSSYKNAMQ